MSTIQLTAQDLVQVLVNFEPVWKYTENEEENGETIEHKSCHDAGGVPNLSSSRANISVEGKSTGKI